MPDANSNFENLINRLKPENEGKLDTDLGSMDKYQATEYVMAFATTLKETEKAYSECFKELDLWKKRFELAKSKNEELLAAQAQAKVDELTAKLANLETEKAELEHKVSFMKDELSRLKNKPELSVDPEVLLEQLKIITGEPDETSSNINKLKAAEELEELKRKLNEKG